ncbi:MAG: hypothetical protein VKJ85_06455 [Prochlorothrix sp.]|nr:hypothetical protein [Prochlorothrix sp.]
MTYSTYDRPMEELPGADEAHSIPSALWKVIDSGDRVQAWLFENDRSAAGGRSRWRCWSSARVRISPKMAIRINPDGFPSGHLNLVILATALL